jgi:hypothetical protein
MHSKSSQLAPELPQNYSKPIAKELPLPAMYSTSPVLKCFASQFWPSPTVQPTRGEMTPAAVSKVGSSCS